MPTLGEKYEWIFGIGRKTLIANRAKCDKVFLRTSSQITGELLRERYDNKGKGDDKHYHGSVIVLNGTGNVEEHVFHMYKDKIYQSIDNKSEWEVRKTSVTFKPNNQTILITAEELKEMTGIWIGEENKCIIEWNEIINKR